MGRRALRVLCVLAIAGTSAVVAMPTLPAAPAAADGSLDLYPTGATCQPNSTAGECRASLEWRNGTYGPTGSQIVRRTLLNVYAQAGEVLALGSSAVGVGTGDAVVWNPGQITDQQAATLPVVTSGTNGFVCSTQRTATGVAAQGRITSRALELAGPQSADGTGNPTGYVPCTYTAPTTGIYQVAFYGPSGPNANTDGGPTGDIAMASANNFSATQGTSVSAWDLTVRADAASTTNVPGRVFTYALAEFTGGNGRPVFQSLYVTTDDGYRYRVDTRGLDPNGFIMFGSRTGFLDPDGTPLDHDVTGNAGGSAMSSLDGGTGIAPPEFPLSFAPLATETLAALAIPATPAPPTVTGLSFNGNIAANNSTISGGGDFHYTGNVAGNYQIVVSRDGVNYDPGNPANAVLLGLGAAGANTVAWDGLDNSGTPFPAGTNYPFSLGLHAGEYHFPELDAENATLGGPTFTLLNPPGGNCPFGRPSCTTAFYDDRGYTVSTGTTVGTPGALLCGTNPPATSHSDPVTGFDSAGAQRAFGTDTGGNTNASCTGSFGDVKGLDSWTYYPSNTTSNTLNIVASPPPGPTAADDSGTVAAGATLNVPAAGLLGNDTGTAIAVSGNGSPASGTATANPDGSYSYTPAPGFSGVDTFTYTITDDLGRTATAQVTITVTPTATPDTATTTDGAPVTVDPTTNDTGTGLTITSVGSPPPGQGTTSIVGGNVTYTPPPGFIGVVTVPYTVTDGDGGTASSTITFTVNPTDPAAADDSVSVAAGSSVSVAAPGLLGNDTGTSIAVSGNGSPAHGTVTVNADGSYVYVPAAGYSGPDSVGYTITDGLGRTATATLVITVTPTAAADSATTTDGTPVTVNPRTNDVGTGLTVTSVGSPPPGQGTTSIVGGNVTYTPPPGFTGVVTVPYTVTDGTGGTASSTITFTVDPAAPTAADDTATVAAGATLTVAASGVLGNDSGASITVTSSTLPAHGTRALAADGSYTYTPAPGFSGVDTFDYTITDSLGRTTTATVIITVTPTAAPDSTSTLADNPVTMDPTTNDAGTGLTVTSVGSPPPGQGTTSIVGGEVVFTPPPGFTGVVTVPYTVTDGTGGTASSTITFTVDPAAPAAPVAVDDTATVTAGDTLTVPTAGVLGNDSGSNITVTSSSAAAHGTRALAADGSYTYTPAPGFSGVDTFDYTITDSLGRTAAATVTINVTPKAATDSVTTTDGTPVTVDPTTNDAGTGLTVTSVGQPPVGQGTTSIVGGEVVFTPPPGFTGVVTVPYTVTDGTGGTASSTITFTVDPAAPAAPAAVDDSATVAAGATLTVAAPGVLGNDSGASITVTSSTLPSHGTRVLAADGSYTYTPAVGFSGVDTFDYTITDSLGRTATATVTITVTPVVVAPPTAVADNGSTPVNQALVVGAPGLLSNDIGSAISVTSNTAPSHGSVAVQPGGGYIYTPTAEYSGPDAFDYTITDSAGRTASATVSIDVTPVAVDDAASTPHNTAVVIHTPVNDHGTALLVTATTQPVHGAVTFDSAGTTYTPPSGFTGTTSFHYTVTDASGQPASANVTVTVGPASAGTGGSGGGGTTGGGTTGGGTTGGGTTDGGTTDGGSGSHGSRDSGGIVRLPFTGAELGTPLGGATTLLVLGIGLVYLGRRRTPKAQPSRRSIDTSSFDWLDDRSV